MTGVQTCALPILGLILAATAVQFVIEGIRTALPAGCHFHFLRTRQAGRRKFVDFHLLVPGTWTVQAGHTLAHEIETKLEETRAELEVTIHVEPIEDESSWEPAALARLGEAEELQG